MKTAFLTETVHLLALYESSSTSLAKAPSVRFLTSLERRKKDEALKKTTLASLRIPRVLNRGERARKVEVDSRQSYRHCQLIGSSTSSMSLAVWVPFPNLKRE